MKNSKLSNLHEIVKVRVPTDYPWRVLDKFVEDLSYGLSEEEQREVKKIIRDRDFASYLALPQTWGLQCTSLSGMSPFEFGVKYQVTSLLKKFRFPSSNKDRREAAKQKFLAAEAQCAEYNRKANTLFAEPPDDEATCVITYAKAFLQKLLGFELPDNDRLTFWSRHGPGANLDTKDRQNSMYYKYQNWPYSCTNDAYWHARSCILADERWRGALEDDYRTRNSIPKHVIIDQDTFLESVISIVPGNRITFVPKNSQTDRSIAIEPSMNLYLQLGVDGFIRRRLKRWGVDLDDQAKNQILAREGSRFWDCPGSFVTLDLAAASDTVTTSVCRHLLPRPWYDYLMDLRSPTGILDGEVISYEKISSMGNGYTFALESAIFTAIVYAVIKHTQGSVSTDDFAIYGDDIVVRKNVADTVVRMLNLFGFNINHDKSFLDGPFRESCGADWYNGEPVRPVFFTTQPSTVMELWCDLNRIRRFLNLRVWGEESKACQLIEKWIPQQLKHVVGPYSDTDFDSYMHVPKPVSRVKNGMWEFQRLVVSARRRKGESFFFRKLMHSLRPTKESTTPWSRKTWGGASISTGNVFDVTQTGSVDIGVVSSLTSNWSRDYVEFNARLA